MTEIPSYMIENPKFEAYKPKKKRYSYSSSIFSMLLSIFSYILIFHVFEVSPSSILKDTKVLFFISNAIILIIAVDYGSFTNKESHDFYGEYSTAAVARRSRPVNYYPAPVMPYQENPRAVETKKLEEEEIKRPKEVIEPMVKEMVYVSHPEKIVQVVSEEKPREDVAMEIYKPVVNDQIVATEETCDTRKHVMNPKQYGRTKSVKSRGVKKTRKDREIERKSYSRSESVCSKWMVVSEKWENVEEESDEFSKMSNEELNKTFEDFIQRFNRQIRQQC